MAVLLPLQQPPDVEQVQQFIQSHFYMHDSPQHLHCRYQLPPQLCTLCCQS